MQILISLIAAFLSLTQLLSTPIASTAAVESWYIIKKSGASPDFPYNADFLSQHGCYYIDDSEVAHKNKTIYLTFDAGYDNGNISKILDTLKEKNTPAAFFILSYMIKNNLDTVNRMIDEGHEVCNHTKNHKDMTTLTKDEMKANLETLENLCFEKTGYRMPKFFRYPEGKYNESTVISAEEFGYKTFFWSMAYADWDNAHQPSEDTAIKTLKANTHPGAIILLHPTSITNAKILGTMIDWWRSEGYTFGTLAELVKNNQ